MWPDCTRRPGELRHMLRGVPQGCRPPSLALRAWRLLVPVWKGAEQSSQYKYQLQSVQEPLPSGQKAFLLATSHIFMPQFQATVLGGCWMLHVSQGTTCARPLVILFFQG